MRKKATRARMPYDQRIEKIDRCLTVYRLYYLKGWTSERIGRHLGIHRVTVARDLQRARKVGKTYLQKGVDDLRQEALLQRQLLTQAVFEDRAKAESKDASGKASLLRVAKDNMKESEELVGLRADRDEQATNVLVFSIDGKQRRVEEMSDEELDIVEGELVGSNDEIEAPRSRNGKRRRAS